jgi:hypothetical protein
MRLRLLVMSGMLPVLLALAGCQALPGRAGPDAAASASSPITGDAIAVTSLDAPADAGTVGAQTPPAARAAEAPPAEATTDIVTDTEPTPAEPPPAEPATPEPPSAEPATPEPPTPEPATPEPPPPVVVKSPAQITCERRGGRWSVTGGGAAAFCQTPTRDGGKSCRASTDCTGYCLEKSRTCAPVTPMLGCHDILNEAGRMLTQCIN